MCPEGLQEPQESTEVRESWPLPGAHDLLEKATHIEAESTLTESLKCSRNYGEFFHFENIVPS